MRGLNWHWGFVRSISANGLGKQAWERLDGEHIVSESMTGEVVCNGKFCALVGFIVEGGKGMHWARKDLCTVSLVRWLHLWTPEILTTLVTDDPMKAHESCIRSLVLLLYTPTGRLI